MIKVYFDNALISDDSYAALSNDYKLFTDNFYLGSTASNTFKLSVAKTAVSSHPAEVKITDDTNTYYLIVDKIYEEKNFYVYDLVDKLVLFNFNYNAKTLIDARAEDELTTTLSDILSDMCTQAGVTLDSTLTLINDIEVTWYDNTLLARDYLSYIAELQGGFARILDDGKLTIVGQKMASQATLQIDNCEDFILGEKKTISRVVYDNGIVKYEYGDETANTLYINPNNVYITDTTVVSNIYDEVVGLEFYLVETGRCQLDPSVRAGDVITFTDGVLSYQTIACYSSTFGGGYWLGNYSLNVASKQQEETQVIGLNTQIKSIKTIVDRTNASLSIVANEVEGLTDFIRNVGTTGEYIELPNTPNSLGAINTLSIKNFELHPLYPGMSYPGSYTYPGALSMYTLVFDSVSTFNATPKYVYINSPIPLQKIGSTYDEISITGNQVSIIQRIGYSGTTPIVLSTPIVHDVGGVLIPTFDGDTYIKVLGFTGLIFNSTYMQKNALTNVFATQLESSAVLSITNDRINSKVSKDGVISEINQTSEQVRITANKIKLEGLVTANENFKILLDGSMEARNGTFSGDVTADNLYLNNGGRVISGEGLLTNLYFRSNGSYSSYSPVGFIQYIEQESGLYNEVVDYTNTYLDIYIPDNFTIVSANLILQHSACRWTRPVSPFDMVWGYSRNIKIHKVNAGKNYKIDNAYNILTIPTIDITEIPNALGSSSWTPSNTTGGTVETKIGIDIKNYLNSGHNILVAKSNDSLPSANNADIVLKTGAVIMTINIVGYMSY